MARDDTRADQAEARAQRRRWLSLAEIVGLAGVVIAGLLEDMMQHGLVRTA